MKNLKELKEKCNLIAEFRNPAFEGKTSNCTFKYRKATMCYLYSDNNGKYYIYKFINKAEIREYENYERAIEKFSTFINIILMK